MSSASQRQADGLKLYHRPMSFWWWLERGAYFKFIVRELTCLFVGAYAVLTLLQVRALGEGPAAYAEFVAMLSTPACMVFSALAFLAVCYHTVTWFQAVPTTMMVRVGGERVPDRVIAGTFYALWVIVSIVVAFLILRG